MKSLLICLWLGAMALTLPAQDGTLVDATPLVFQDVDLKKLEKAMPDARDILKLIEVRRLTYLSDGLKVKGYLLAPRQGKGLPCVIYNRSGNREMGALSDLSSVLLLGRMASWGYVVVASQYRGNGGGEGQEEFGGKDGQDVLNLLPLLKSLPQADATRVGMVGWSRGGMMTYQALAKTDQIAAAVVGAGTTDLFTEIQHRPGMEKALYEALIPDYANRREAELTARSAVRWAEKFHKKTPLLILHGSADWRVQPVTALSMASRLLQTQHPFRLVMFEGGDHTLTEHREEADRLTRDWLDRYVRDRKPWPSLEPHGR